MIVKLKDQETKHQFDEAQLTAETKLKFDEVKFRLRMKIIV